MGKISVKHYLNKKVKPSDEPDFSDLPEYPIYYYITINRRTIHKPSNIRVYLNDELFETGVTLAGEGNTIELMKYERRIITTACELFLSDYEAGKVNQKYRLLFRRGFTAKDEFINGLNSYIEFYKRSIYGLVCDYTRKEINKYLVTKLRNSLDLSRTPNTAGNRIQISINTDSLIADTLGFYKDNLDSEHLNLYYLERYMYTCLAETNMKYSYDLPLAEWLHGDLKASILEIVTNKEDSKWLKQQCGDFGFNKQYFEKYFEPIINKVCTLEWQLNMYTPYYTTDLTE